jgi:hypothetical protein
MTKGKKSAASRGGFGGRARAFRQRFLLRLRSRFALRLHMTLIMMVVVASGVLFSRLLWAHGHGLHSMAVRYLTTVLLSYGVFFVCFRIWLWFMESDSQAEWDAPDLGNLAGGGGGGGGGSAQADVAVSDCGGGDWGGDVDAGAGGDWSAAEIAEAGGDAGGGSGGGGGGGGDWGGDLGGADEGVVLILIGVVVVAVLGAGVYVVWEAPLIMSEAAFQVVLAGALARTARRARDGQLAPSGATPSWSWLVLRKTWIPLAVVLLVAGLAGFMAKAHCPSAQRMHDALHCPKKGR